MIKIINATKNPISHIGKIAGVCYNSDITDSKKNYKRGLKNIKDNHGRTFEYVDVTLEISGYSARAIRELYTHIIGTSRLQESTRYVTYNEDNFKYYIPDSIINNIEAKVKYESCMRNILHTYNDLLSLGIAKEDVANILPLGQMSKVVLKINFRALLHLAEMRLCERAYVEIRNMVYDMIHEISKIDDEWKELMSYMKPKCKTCTEKENCPRIKNN